MYAHCAPRTDKAPLRRLKFCSQIKIQFRYLEMFNHIQEYWQDPKIELIWTKYIRIEFRINSFLFYLIIGDKNWSPNQHYRTVHRLNKKIFCENDLKWEKSWLKLRRLIDLSDTFHWINKCFSLRACCTLTPQAELVWRHIFAWLLSSTLQLEFVLTVLRCVIRLSYM